MIKRKRGQKNLKGVSKRGQSSFFERGRGKVRCILFRERSKEASMIKEKKRKGAKDIGNQSSKSKPPRAELDGYDEDPPSRQRGTKVSVKKKTRRSRFS